MAAPERDSSGDWLLPASGGPPTMYEIERRVELALAVARAAETAALEIGAASLEAARQARRAADLAERASRAAAAGVPVPTSNRGNGLPLAPGPAAPEPEPVVDHQLEEFLVRSRRVADRLGRLQPV